jgi:hypothetical protein
MAESIDGPVGLRSRTQNVTNNARDQDKVIKLLAAIPESQGGKRDAWKIPPLSGGDRNCPKFVADAIWEFQTFWKARGVCRIVDGVVDPGKTTIRKLNELASSAPPQPKPSTDMIVLIKGWDPKAAGAGEIDKKGGGEPGIDVPSAADLKKSIEQDPQYPKSHVLRVDYWFGGGGRANPHTDPTNAVVTSIKDALRDAKEGEGTFGTLVILGFSIGGRNAVSVAQALKADVPIAYLGIADAAFDDDKDPTRTNGGFSPSQSHNFFQSLTNELPGQEFHGEVKGCHNVPSFDNMPEFQERKKKYDGQLWSTKKDANNYFDQQHKAAVRLGMQQLIPNARKIVLGQSVPD